MHIAPAQFYTSEGITLGPRWNLEIPSTKSHVKIWMYFVIFCDNGNPREFNGPGVCESGVAMSQLKISWNVLCNLYMFCPVAPSGFGSGYRIRAGIDLQLQIKTLGIAGVYPLYGLRLQTSPVPARRLSARSGLG